MHKVGRDNPVKNMFFDGLARTLGGVPLSAMERYARKKGPEHERVIEKIKTRTGRPNFNFLGLIMRAFWDERNDGN